MKNNKTKLLLLIAILTLFVIYKLFWLITALVLLTITYYFLNFFLDLLKEGFIKSFLKTTFSFITLLLVIISVRLFVFDIYLVPSSSMENALYKDDIIVANKLKYGPRLPRSPFDIPLINIVFYFNKNAKKRIKQYWWPCKRLSGVTTVKQGDIMVFNSTWRKDFILVKRCVALPGDTFTLKNTNIYTNNNLYSEPSSIRNNINNRPRFKETNNRKKCFFNKLYDWNYNNMGPFRIPKKGLTIPLNAENLALYKKTIKRCEKVTIKEDNGHCYINSKEVKNYTFKYNYYFMMGDNRNATEDSRAWGFVPEQNIIGKVDYVLYSNYGGEFNRKRFLKTIN